MQQILFGYPFDGNLVTASVSRMVRDQDHIRSLSVVLDCEFNLQDLIRAGFPIAFMSGFTTSAARLGAPDTGLMSYGEMVDQGR